MQKRFTTLDSLCKKFDVLWLFSKMSDEEIETKSSSLKDYYNTDLDKELLNELKHLKVLYAANFGIHTLNATELLNAIHVYEFHQLFPNVIIGLRIFLTIPASVASAERSFSTLKRVKNVLRSTTSQGRLSSIGVLSVETETARTLDIENLIENFVSKKTRKIYFA